MKNTLKWNALALFMLLGSIAQAQINLSYEHYTNASAVRLSFDKPSDLFFSSYTLTYAFSDGRETKSDADEEFQFLDKIDLSYIFGLGFNSLLNMPPEIEPYAAARLGLHGLSIEVGSNYMFSDKFGVKVHAGQYVTEWNFAEDVDTKEGSIFSGFYFGIGGAMAL